MKRLPPSKLTDDQLYRRIEELRSKMDGYRHMSNWGQKDYRHMARSWAARLAAAEKEYKNRRTN